MRAGKMVDRREFFWEDLPEFALSAEIGDAGTGTDHVGTGAPARPGEQSSPAHLAGTSETLDEPSVLSQLRGPQSFHPGEFFSALLKQLYIGQPYVPRNLYVPVDFEDREELEDLLSDQDTAGPRTARVHILVPRRGDKRSLIDLAGTNAKQSYDQRFRVLKPNARKIQEELQEVIGLPDLPKRIECFDISHIQGAETVASMVVWEDGKMKKSDYRKFIIRTVEGVDDFASMREVVTRRYKRLQDEQKAMPSLVLIDGGLGQLHTAAEALEKLEIINQPLASIAKREEILYVYGQERDPIALDHHSPVLHLIQLIRDEAHRFAVTFHRKRRQMRDRSTELLEIPGVGARTTRRLLEHFGSVQAVKQADAAALSAVVTRVQAEAIRNHFHK
jgi:excinuclease ABC subunit C